jgi:hypothetical protein
MKTELKSLFLVGALCASTAAFAQGVLEYEWHGDSGIFQGSFRVHDNVTDFSTDPLYPQSFTVTSSQFPTLTNGWYYGSAPVGFFFNGIISGTGVEVNVLPTDVKKGDVVIAMQSGATGIDGAAHATESWIGLGRFASEYFAKENGYWAVVPEPSAFALLGLGLLGLYMKKATSRS